MPSPEPAPDPVLVDVANVAARVIADDLRETGVLPLDRIAHVIFASVDAYLMFSGRAGRPGPQPSVN